MAGVEEVDILWISEGMSCDGDSVSVTAAGQPSIEDVLLGAIPGLPKVNLHNKVLSPDARRRGVPDAVPGGGPRRGRAPVRAGDRGLDPQREDQRRRLLDLVRQRRGDRRAADAELVDRPARAEGLGRRRDRHLRDLRRHPRDGRQPDGLHGPRRLPRLGLPLRRRPADRQRPRLPGPARELHGDARLAALPGGRPGAGDPARRPAAPDVDLRQDRARGLRPRGLLRAGRLRGRLQLAQVPREGRLLGAGGQLQRPQARLDERARRLPERRRHLHRLHDAGLPRQVHAVHGRAARRRRLGRDRARLRPADAAPALDHQQDGQQGAEVAAQRAAS